MILQDYQAEVTHGYNSQLTNWAWKYIYSIFKCICKCLSLVEVLVAVAVACMGAFQEFCSTSQKPGKEDHKLPKQNNLLFGMEVWIENTQGTWSELGHARGFTIVLGNTEIHLADEKNQSNYLKSIFSCILLHVYHLPLFIVLNKAKLLMISLIFF